MSERLLICLRSIKSRGRSVVLDVAADVAVVVVVNSVAVVDAVVVAGAVVAVSVVVEQNVLVVGLTMRDQHTADAGALSAVVEHDWKPENEWVVYVVMRLNDVERTVYPPVTKRADVTNGV